MPTWSMHASVWECSTLNSIRRIATIRFRNPGMEINLGSIGKGYALDRVAELLATAGIENFLLHGGNSSVLGRGGNGTSAGRDDTANPASPRLRRGADAPIDDPLAPTPRQSRGLASRRAPVAGGLGCGIRLCRSGALVKFCCAIVHWARPEAVRSFSPTRGAATGTFSIPAPVGRLKGCCRSLWRRRPAQRPMPWPPRFT